MFILPFQSFGTVLQLVSRISANATQYSLPDGTLVHLCDKWISFTVKNTGSGSHTWGLKLVIRNPGSSSYLTTILSDELTLSAGSSKSFDYNTVVTGTHCANGMDNQTTNNPGSYELLLIMQNWDSPPPPDHDLALLTISNSIIVGTSSSSYNNPQAITIIENTNCCNAGCGGGTFSISGNIKDAGSAGINGVYVSASNGGGNDYTNSSGYYSLTVSSGWSGNITPSMSGCTFFPPNKNYNNVTTDKVSQDFTGNCSTGSAPNAYFTFSPTTVSTGQLVTFTDESTNNPTAWDWNFHDGNHAYTQSPTYAYSSPGTYYVTLTVSNAYGSNSWTTNIALVVITGIVAPILISPGNNYQFNVVPSSVSYSWNTNSNPSGTNYILRVRDLITNLLVVDNFQAGTGSFVTLTLAQHNNQLIMNHSYIWTVSAFASGDPLPNPGEPLPSGAMVSSPFTYDIVPPACYPQLDGGFLPQLSFPLPGSAGDYCIGCYYVYGDDWAWSTCGVGNPLKKHAGWDIRTSGQNNTAYKDVINSYDGQVVAVFDAGKNTVTGENWGKGVVVRHSYGSAVFTTTYTHINPLSIIKKGYPINRNEVIGKVIDLEAEHLHYSIRKGEYTQTANRGALPAKEDNINPGDCLCKKNGFNDPVFPEFLINPQDASYTYYTTPIVKKSIQTTQSILSGASISIRRNTEIEFREFGITDDCGYSTLHLPFSFVVGDSLKIENPGSYPLSFAIDAASVNFSEWKVPMIRNQNPVTTISYPFVKILSSTPVAQDQNLQLKITAKQIIGYEIGFINDTTPYIFHLPSDSLITLVLKDTGYAFVEVNFLGVDTVSVVKEIHYYPGQMFTDSTYVINLQIDPGYYGTKLFIDDQFIKEYSSSGTINVPQGLHSLMFSRFGYKDTIYTVSGPSTLNIFQVPKTYHSTIDSAELFFSGNSVINFWKCLTVLNTLGGANPHISIKQVSDPYNLYGFIPVTRSFIFRNLAYPNSSSFKASIVLDQPEYLDPDSIYLMRIFDNTNYQKIPISSTNIFRYDSVLQKLTYDSLTFDSGLKKTETIVLLKKQAPKSKGSSFAINLLEDIPGTIPLSSLFNNPDSISGDMVVTLISTHPPNLSVSIVGQNLVLLGDPDWNGTTSITVSATHDWLTTQSTIPVIIHPMNDPPVFGSVPSLSMCSNETSSIALNPFITDIDNTLNQITVTAIVTSTNNPFVPTSALKINIDPVTHSATITSDPISGNTTFNVGYIATDDSLASDSSYSSITIYSKPANAYSFVTTCFGDTIPFTDKTKVSTGSTLVSWLWNFDDPNSTSNISNKQNPGHLFTSTGAYHVSLITTNNRGCIDTITKLVTVFPLPVAEYTWNLGSGNLAVTFHVDTTLADYKSIGNMVRWYFGDGDIGFGLDPTHVYPAGGTFNVVLKIVDTIGCSDSITHAVLIPELPHSFYASNSPVCLNTPMCFTDLSSVPSPPFGYIANWVWTFGDGTPNDTIHFPNNPNICHTYAALGAYTVTEKVTANSGFTDSYSHTQIVAPSPIANFYFSTGCAGKLIQFTEAFFPNGGGNIISWNWDFDDPLSGINNTSNQTNPTHIFNTGGITYNVRLIIQNVNNCIDTIIKPVYISLLPPVDFTRDTACLTELVHFYANTTLIPVDSIVSWLWDFGDGTAPSADAVNSSHLYTADGTYIATLTISDHHGCANTISHQVKVNPLPIPEFSWSNPACTKNPVLFTDQSNVPAGYTGYIAKWKWDFGDGNTQYILYPSSPSITHLFPVGSLTHIVRLTVWTSDSCSLFKEHNVIGIPSPIADYSYSTVNCKNQPVQFTDLSQANGGGSVTQWNWNFGDPSSGFNNLSTLPNPTHTYVVTGSYTVTLIIHNSNGCSDSIFKTFTVNTAPLTNFIATETCLNNPTQFTDFSVPNAANIISYSWNFGDGSPLSSQQNPSHLYAAYGMFMVTLTVVNSNGCSKDTTKQIQVHPLPIPEFSFTSPSCFGAVVSYTDLSALAPGYLGHIQKWVWDFNDGTIVTINFPIIPNVTHNFSGPALTHIVRLTVTNSDSCTAFIDHVVNSIPSPIANFDSPATSCDSQSVQFTDQSQINGGGSIISWNWDFGDSATGTNNSSTAQNPIHFFSGFGTYTVSLIESNTSGCRDTVSKTVFVNPLPLARFTANPACEGSLTTFTNTSIAHSASILSYSWDFGDGSPLSTMQNPTHTYTTYGIKNVMLTIVNSDGCIKDTVEPVVVYPLPIAAFTYTTPNCFGALVQFTNQSAIVTGYLGSIVRWHWDFGDGTSTTITGADNPNVSHAFFGSSMQHIVTLIVTTSDSCSSSISHTANSMPSPIASFSFPANNCASQSVQFSDLSQANGGGNITQWSWNFGDPLSGVSDNSSSQSPAHTFIGGPDVYTVTEIIFNSSGCSDTTIQNITIVTLPVANFHANTACLGSLTTFTDQSTTTGTITQHSWDFGDGFTSNLASPTHLYASSGVFHVVLTVTNNVGCIGHTTIDVFVIQKPAASFITTVPTCFGDSVYFTDLSTTPHGTITTWLWTFGDGGTITRTSPQSPNVSHMYGCSGTYTMTLTITTSDNCSDSKYFLLVIQPAPVANYTYATTRCAQMPIQFTDQSQTGGGSAITQWLWNFDDPISGSANTSTIKNAIHSFTHNGSFGVKLTVTSAIGCPSSDSTTVTVNASPVAKFKVDTACVGGLTHFTDQSTTSPGTINAWLWNFGEPSSGTNNSSTLQNPTHNYSAPGLYTAILTVTNSSSCPHDTTVQVSVNPKPQAMFSASIACADDSTAFTDLSIAPGSGISAWHWNFGDGGSSTIQNPKHKYETASTFNVVLTVTNLSGCKDSIMIPVMTHPKPFAAFTYTSFFCPAGQVRFQDQSHGVGSAIVQREWIFQPGSTSSLIEPTFIFSKTDTTYLVSLIVTDSYGCKDTVSDSVHVKPGFAFTFRNDTVCYKNPSHFTTVDLAKGDSLYSVSWNFGDPNSGTNNISYLFKPSHTFLLPGIYNVRLKTTDSDNCTDSLFREVIVRALPAPAFSILSSPCDSVIHFHDSSTVSGSTVRNWIWNFGDGAIDTISESFGSGDTSHIYLVQSTYQVTLTVITQYGCSDTLTKTTQVYPCIFAAFTHNDTLMCSRYNIALADSSLPAPFINQWHWIFGDGLDTTYTHPIAVIHHTFANPGFYPVRLIIHATLGYGRTFVDSAMQSLIIRPTPQPNFSNLSVCKKQTTLFKDTSNTFGAAINSYNWIFGESYSGSSDTSHLKDPTHKYDSAGVYTVKLVTMNHFGCKDSITKPTRVFENPTAIFNHSPACCGNPTYFTDTSVIADTANIIKWIWNFGEVTVNNDTSLLRDPAYQYKTEGNYQVRLIVKDLHGCFDTVDSSITVHVTPTSAFTFTENMNNMIGKLLFNNKSNGADSYLWDFGNGQTSTDENPVVTYANDGSFQIMLVSNNQFKCSDTTYYRYEFIFKGLYIPNAFAPGSLIPGANVFSPIGINLKQFKIEVFDNWGHMVWNSTALDPLGRPTELWDGKGTDNGFYPSGTYIWKASATFIDNSEWEGSDIGKGQHKTIGTVTLIR